MSRWRRVGERGAADTLWGIAAVIAAVLVLGGASGWWMKRVRAAAKEAGGVVGDFEATRTAAKNAANTIKTGK